MVLGRTKGKAATPSAAIIVIHDSDSEPETSEPHIAKRQRTIACESHSNRFSTFLTRYPRVLTASASTSLPGANSKMKNAHLKGRKRFTADFDDMKDEIKKTPLHVHGLRVTSMHVCHCPALA